MPIPDQVRARVLSIRAILFLALLLPVWALGVLRGERLIGSVAVLPPFFGEDLARFDRVRPRLRASAGAILLLDSSARSSYGQRYFAAQYSLAPTVLSLAFAVDAVAGEGWKGEPRYVLCVFDDPGRHAAALAALESATRRRGLGFLAEPVDGVLTLVRLGGAGPP
ncbi:MAG: hypothetical protein ABI689_12930 [Thermoanaerobaculia bacterium]